VGAGAEMGALRHHGARADRDSPLVVKPRAGSDQHLVAEVEIGGQPDFYAGMDAGASTHCRAKAAQDERRQRCSGGGGKRHSTSQLACQITRSRRFRNEKLGPPVAE